MIRKAAWKELSVALWPENDPDGFSEELEAAAERDDAAFLENTAAGFTEANPSVYFTRKP